jgi:hypothetical protein
MFDKKPTEWENMLIRPLLHAPYCHESASTENRDSGASRTKLEAVSIALSSPLEVTHRAPLPR